MKYEPKRTYDMEAFSMKELGDFSKEVYKALAEKDEEYDRAVEDLFTERIPVEEEIDYIAKKFNVPYDYVEYEGWFFVAD